MSLSAELVCAGLFVVTLLRPAVGVGLWVALIPLLDYAFNAPQFSYDTLTVFAATLAGAVLLRQFRAGPAFWRPLLLFCGFLGLLLSVSIAHYWSILAVYPRLGLDNLFAADQLNPFVFFGKTTVWAIAAVLFLGLVRICRESESERRILLFLVWVQAPVYLGVLAFDFIRNGKPFPGTLLSSLQQSQPGLFGIFNEHNTFASFFLLHAFLLIGGIIAARSWRTRSLALLMLGTYAMLIAFSLSLTTVAAFGLSGAVVLLVLVWQHRRGRHEVGLKRFDRRLVLVGLVMVAAVGLAGLYIGHRQVGHAITSRVNDATWQGIRSAFYERRGYGWRVATEMIGDYPFLGIGLGRFYLEFRDYRERLGTEGAGWFFQHTLHENAHNYFLQVAAEGGLVGLVLLIWFLARIFNGAFRGPPESAAAAYGLIAMISVSLLQHPLLVEALFFTTVPVAALAAVPGSRLSLPRRWWGGVLLGLTLMGTIIDFHHAAGRMPKEFEYGLFGVEQGPVGPYRWTGPIALKRGPWLKGEERFQVRPAVAGLEAFPLMVHFRTLNHDKQLVSWAPVEPDWVPFELSLDPGDLLAIDCSRVLRPPGEYRTLGIAITVGPDSGFRPPPLRVRKNPTAEGKLR